MDVALCFSCTFLRVAGGMVRQLGTKRGIGSNVLWCMRLHVISLSMKGGIVALVLLPPCWFTIWAIRGVGQARAKPIREEVQCWSAMLATSAAFFLFSDHLEIHRTFR